MSENMMQKLLGLDVQKEIFDMKTEIFHLYNVINHLLQNSPELEKPFTKEIQDKCIKDARERVVKKFPHFGIKFEDFKKPD